LLDSLDADSLRRRLDDLDGERRALTILLRVARARDRGRQADPQVMPAEGRHDG
jgi:hypothetical protein